MRVFVVALVVLGLVAPAPARAADPVKI